MEWARLSGDGRVKGWTQACLATVPGVSPPFTIVEVELAEQPGLVLIALADLAGAREIAIDRRVQVVFRPETDGTAYAWVTVSERTT